jgi:hypothetical protein
MTIVYKSFKTGNFPEDMSPTRRARAEALYWMIRSGYPRVSDPWTCLSYLQPSEKDEHAPLFFTPGMLTYFLANGWTRREFFEAADDLVKAGLAKLEIESFFHTRGGEDEMWVVGIDLVEEALPADPRTWSPLGLVEQVTHSE